MGPSSSLANEAAELVLDASVIISLNASGYASEIIMSLPHAIRVVRNVLDELALASGRDRHDGKLLADLVAEKRVEIGTLDEISAATFADLVAGHAAATLDDGEAATIAYANQCGGIAVIDERKANRICTERFPSIQLACTTDLFMHPHVLHTIGHDKLVDAVGNALVLARMRVFPAHVDWVVNLIGIERAKACTSLPLSVRSGKESTAKRPRC
jgi:hypothetical protein